MILVAIEETSKDTRSMRSKSVNGQNGSEHSGKKLLEVASLSQIDRLKMSAAFFCHNLIYATSYLPVTMILPILQLTV